MSEEGTDAERSEAEVCSVRETETHKNQN